MNRIQRIGSYILILLVLAGTFSGCALLGNTRASADGNAVTPEPPSAPTAPPPSSDDVDISSAMITPSPNEVQQPDADVFADTEACNYFLSLVFREDGSTVTKWAGPIRIQIEGNPTAADTERVAAFVALVSKMSGMPDIEIVNRDGNLRVLIDDGSELYGEIPGYTKNNWGYTYTYHSKGVVTEAIIGITKNLTNQEQRNHMIYEELYKAFGFLQGNNKYEESILYSYWTETQELTQLDVAVMKILYDKRLSAGNARADVEAAFAAARTETE